MTFSMVKSQPKIIYKVMTDKDGKRGDCKLLKGMIPPGWDILTQSIINQLTAEKQEEIVGVK